jgi:hypothetical protein
MKIQPPKPTDRVSGHPALYSPCAVGTRPKSRTMLIYYPTICAQSVTVLTCNSKQSSLSCISSAPCRKLLKMFLRFGHYPNHLFHFSLSSQLKKSFLKRGDWVPEKYRGLQDQGLLGNWRLGEVNTHEMKLRYLFLSLDIKTYVMTCLKNI